MATPNGTQARPATRARPMARTRIQRMDGPDGSVVLGLAVTQRGRRYDVLVAWQRGQGRAVMHPASARPLADRRGVMAVVRRQLEVEAMIRRDQGDALEALWWQQAASKMKGR